MPRPDRPYHPRNVPVDDRQERTHPLYATWAGMLTRCFVETDPSFKNYGGRGISVCPRWWHFRFFAEDMGLRPDGLTLERENNDEGYEPSNCKWATRTEQARNRRRFRNNTSGHTGIRQYGNRFVVRITHNGVRYKLGRTESITEALLLRQSAKERIAMGDLPVTSADTLWCTSTTGVRGVTAHQDGGFVARTTVNGERKYLGYFKTFEEACDAKRRANQG